jgi:ATP-dependent Lhr-like helicase
MTPLECLERKIASAFYGRFVSLRPVQEGAINPILAGNNVVLSSGTGSGKTEAVLAPLVNRYYSNIFEEDQPIILYIAPTKALVNDLERRISSIVSSSLNIRVGIRHGDRDDLKSGQPPHILITTPESLEVLLFRKDKALDKIRTIVLDEVHLLYNTQRGLQLSVLLHRLRSQNEHDLQWVAISATIARLENIQDFLCGTSDENTVFLQYPSQRSIDAHVRHIKGPREFLDLILKIVENQPTKLLIFTNDRNSTERLAGILQSDKTLEPAVFTHYSSLSPDVRHEIERNFSTLRTAICIATSTLELGIDIGDIDAVILWNVPGNVESFLQRIGRGNRRSNKTNVICLVPDTSLTVVIDTLRFLALIDMAKRGEMPVRSPYNLYGSFVQQCIIQIAIDNGQFKKISEIFKNFDYFRYMSRPILEEILAELASNDYLTRHGFKNQYGAGENLYKLIDYRLIYGNFSAQSQTVEVNFGSKNLGDIPMYNLLTLKTGDVIRFAGQDLKIREIKNKQLQVERTARTDRAKPIRYFKKGIGFDPVLTERIWQLIHDKDISIFSHVESSLRNDILQFRDNLQTHCNNRQIPTTVSEDSVCYSTFAGYLVNKALCLINGIHDFEIDDISIKVKLAQNVPIDWASISPNPHDYSRIFDSLFEVTSEQSIYQEMLPENLQKEEFLQEWLKNDYIPKILERLKHSELVKTNAI